ncbi:MAG TPA: ABC transporter permease [Epulopiscium sp.]|nr:ABC transporter permease [Candidatus Epulonipiscium sp.]
MKFRTIKHLIKEGIAGIWENRLMSFAATGTIVLCLIILGLSYSIAANVDYLLKQVESTIGITAYIDTSLEQPEIMALKNKIEAIPHVTIVSYISKDEALASFSEDQSIKNIMDQFKEDNPLPASFEIHMDELENQESIVKSLEQYKELELNYFQTETPMLVQLGNSIRLISLVVIACLTLVGILLMSNTIKLTVYIRRKEINIMKYIGATDWFIRGPFIVEGIAIGLLGAIIPIFVILGAYKWFTQTIYASFSLMMESVKLQETTVILANFIPMSLIIGISIGVIGSGIAIRKHLDV